MTAFRGFRLLLLWNQLRYSYWFLPALMTLAAALLAFGMVTLDGMKTGGLIEKLGWVYSGDSDGARELLSVVAGSMITVAGVVFSIMIVALQLASSQFGPRVLRNFMQDRGNQIVLGAFISTFVYCLLVLRTIRSGDDAFVPSLSVTTGVALALMSLGVLIFFIHHAALSIQANQIVQRIGHELYEVIDHLFPEEMGEQKPEGRPEATPRYWQEVITREGRPIRAESTGYLQSIGDGHLMALAEQHDLAL